MKNPEVSVIVPIFNSEKTLERTIRSVLGQTLKNIELLLVDDGSTDESVSICRKYESLDSRITVIEETNSGVSCARNKGIACARGKYMTFCDSDDELVDDFLEQAIKDCESEELDLWIGTSVRIARGQERGRNEPWMTMTGYCDTLTEKQLIMIFNSAACCYGKVYKRSAIPEITFIPELSWGEDLVFSFTCLNKHLKFMAKPKVVYLYHWHDGGLASSINERKCYGFAQTYRFLFFLIKNRDFPSEGELSEFVIERFFGDLAYIQNQIIRVYKTLKLQRKMYDVLLSDPILYEMACRRGKEYTSPLYRKIKNLWLALKEKLWVKGVIGTADAILRKRRIM